jgi:hypothetical protein
VSITISDISNLLVQSVPQVFADGTTRETYFSRLISKRPPTKAGGSQWKFKTTGVTAAAVAEGDPLPAASKFTQLDPQLNAAYFAAAIEITDETMHQIESGLIVFSDYLAQTVADAMVALQSSIESATVAGLNATNGFVGLDLWASDTGSPAGINRATYSAWQAYFNDASGTPRPLTMALMRDVADVLVGTRQGRFTHVCMAPSKATVYSGLSGAGQVQRVFNVNNGDMGSTPAVGIGSALDVMKPFSYFDEAPCLKVPTMPSDVVWFLDLDAIHYEEIHPITVSEPRRTNNRSTVWDITTGLTLVVPNPYKNCAAVADLS